MANRNRDSLHANLLQTRLGGFISGTYATRPAASNALRNATFLATDVGLSPGTTFFCNGTSWKQVGECYLCINTTNVVADSGHLVKSVFDTAPTIPNGSVAVGTAFSWKFRMNLTDAGSNDAAAKYEMLIGATGVGNRTYAAFGEYNFPEGIMLGDMVCRSTGGGGSVIGALEYLRFTSVNGLQEYDIVSTDTATTVDTTGSVSPDVVITLSSITNSPVRTVFEAWIKVSGLI